MAARSRPALGRPGLLLAALLLAALAAPHPALAWRGRPAFPSRPDSPAFFPGDFVITFEDGTRGLADKTDGVQASVAASLAAEAAAVTASLGQDAAAAVLAAPLTTVYVSPYEVGKKGQPIPGPISVVRMNERLLDGASARPPAADAIADRIVHLMEQAPGVAHVSRHTLAQRLTVCGLSWSPAAECPRGQCCRADTGTCEFSDDACGHFCQPLWGGCDYGALQRTYILNAKNPLLGGNLPGHEMIEATTPTTDGYLTTAHIQPDQPEGKYTVMIMDTGVGPHKALNVVGCRNYFPANQLSQGAVINHDGKTECYDDKTSHGTHVAGIVGAKNGGWGMWGVLPNVRIWAARSTDPLATKGMSAAGFYEAMGDILDNDNEDSVAVINMSWGGGAPDASFDTNFCRRVQALRKQYGIIFVTASGNKNREMPADELPGLCDGVIITTAASRVFTTSTKSMAGGKAVISKFYPALWSTWVSAVNPDATEAAKRMARTVMAPGELIYSTIRNNGYTWMFGTSMAAPHVAGIAARCFAAGDCQLSYGQGDNNLNKVLDAFNARNADPNWRWDNAAKYGAFSQVKSGVRQYYGPMAWAAHW